MKSLKYKRSSIQLVLIFNLIFIPLSGICQITYFEQDEWRQNYMVDEFSIDMPKSGRVIENKGTPYQFAIPFNTDKSIYITDGDRSIDGYYHYFLEVNATDAYAINFTLKGLKEADVEAVYVNSNKNIDGPYKPDQNDFDLSAFPNYYSNKLTIELISKRKQKEHEITLYRLGIVYDQKLLKSGECQVDINCDEGANWQDVKQAVVRIQYDNIYLCTGTILNNTLNDQTPYLLTANHCISTPQSAANAIFAFNYEAPYCDAPSYEYPGVSSNRLVGATLKATKDDAEGKLDFTLLELNDEIPEDFNTHFAGWNASSQSPQFVAGIHHPGGDVKKISIDYDDLLIGSFSQEFDSDSFWRILRWDVGVTEGGSSGSAIFNEGKQVLGDLTGGEASCDYPFNDFYSRFDLAFDKYSDSSQQLKYWLDPAGYDVRSWFGIPEDEVADSLEVYVYPNPAHAKFQVYSPTLDGDVKIELFDTKGILIWENELTATSRVLFVNVPVHVLGLHYMRLETANKIIKRKVVFY